ncbi:MAG: hypothetical protein KF832_26690 [Caldilineaceae bacterium]|nr:hypothetical protein [Caldilineaceae bacterium]
MKFQKMNRRLLVSASKHADWMLWLLTIWLAGCRMETYQLLPPPTSATIPLTQPWHLGTAAYTNDEAAVTALILAERQAAIDHDLALLATLWAVDAQIVDDRQSATPSDNYTWQGRAAILDRYQVAVFPFALPPLSALDATTTLTLTAQMALVQQGDDEWALVKLEQRWWLQSLRYQQGREP